jgi:hypothetical protein
VPEETATKRQRWIQLSETNAEKKAVGSGRSTVRGKLPDQADCDARRKANV